MSFSTLGLSEKVLAAVEASGYTEPTAIQAGAIPYVLERRDVLGIAQTGTGKTASFTLPMITLLEKGRARARMPRTLILEPTRELAAQVEDNFNRYGVNHKLNVALLIGGVSFAEQDRKLERGADVLIATPGRLLDHFERGKLLLQGVDILVIDEADRMLDMGFIPDIERICKLIPFTRQTLFFSATMPSEIQRLTDTFLQNPAKVEVAKASTTAETVTQRIAAAEPEDYEKRAKLRELIEGAEDLQNAIVFCNRKRDVATLFRSLVRHEFSVGALHGDMDQRSRMTMLDNFKKGNIKILVASDVAARGLDIPSVSHVFNFDLPIQAEDYVHRIGRTGRAGRDGTAISIVTGKDEKALQAINETIGKELEWVGEPVDFSAPVEEKKSRRRSTRGQKDKNRSRKSKAEAQEAPVQEADSVPAGLEEQPMVPMHTERRAPARARGGRRANQPKDEAIFRNASHIPAFLLRETRSKVQSR
ncbi:Superfamily II DNA and RNA helicase [Pseudovibrio denitrificans]|uniref:DEAD-box ATP-dependent RNA helicase RhpA n=1 Tax=Pseudovibrio denitrificans TaxID=258256 RepID=A0A1I6XJ73_9HYPH|nr:MULTISPECIES: DEAD/DEAH box helicase [Pseudovibrio]EEA96901.1 ATP-dependent RNA helicase [Pseudovibrio sp. JE062]SFT38127.1 Superfamily II DNA and RNA helicase [Pseudovibrio denitrificans]